MYWESIQADEYKPSIIIEEYDTELEIANSILGKKYPMLWKNFTRMRRKYCKEHKAYTVNRSTKETSIDYFIENNEDIAKKETAQTPPKTKKSKRLKRNGTEKSKKERKNFKRSQKKSLMDGKNERKTDKQTSSLDVAPTRIETDKYEDEYFSHISSIESDDEPELNSVRFPEAEKVLRKITQGKNNARKNETVTKEEMQETVKSNEQGKDLPRREPHIFPEVVQIERIESLSDTSEDGRECQNRGKPVEKRKRKGNNEEKVPKTVQTEQLPYNRSLPPPVVLEGKPVINEEAYLQMKKCCKENMYIKYARENTLIHTECIEDFERIKFGKSRISLYDFKIEILENLLPEKQTEKNQQQPADSSHIPKKKNFPTATTKKHAHRRCTYYAKNKVKKDTALTVLKSLPYVSNHVFRNFTNLCKFTVLICMTSFDAISLSQRV
ncbi:hypothetical protein JTB14_004079 [Gonioctena quinquepunctata]|nr:hypothetical protein JTB14_004079 [Gonioctena quinquepunctata]